MQQEPIPGIAYEYGLDQRFLPEITLAEVNALARDWVPDRNRVVAVSAPKKAGRGRADEATLAAAIKGAGGGALTAYVDTVSTQPLLEPLPDAGHRREDDDEDALGITEWKLSNGVRVVLKPTTFKQDEILFRAFSPGGTSLAERRGLRRRRDRRPGRGAGRARRADARSTWARSWPARRRSSGRHRRHVTRGSAAAPRGAISRRCSS